jgi:hypothetical protein
LSDLKTVVAFGLHVGRSTSFKATKTINEYAREARAKGTIVT